MSILLIRAFPLFGRINPASTFIVVLLPAPFGPTSNVISPAAAQKVMPRKTRLRP